MLAWPILVLLLIVCAGVIFLQIFLSKRDSRWFGLILPAVSFIVSLILSVSIIAYTNIGIVSRSVSEDGVIVSHEIEDTRPGFGAVVLRVVATFLLANIFTAVLVVLYVVFREKRKQRLEIGKMQVQDLE